MRMKNRKSNEPLTMALLGDISLNGLFNSEPEKNADRFRAVDWILRSADLVFANLETPAWGNGQLNEEKREKLGVLLYSYIPVLEEVLPQLNISVVSLANNHIYDCKKEGVENTVNCLEQLNIRFTGAGYKPKHLEPVMILKKGVTIGFMAYVHQATRPIINLDHEKEGIYINLYDEREIINEIRVLKKRCDRVILSLHWGDSYSFYPTLWQRRAAQRFVEAGADVILGHHPHTLQPYEIYNKGLIFYSLGSFCFGDFIYEGQLRSLKRKTKKTFLPIINTDKIQGPNIVAHFSLKELPGNTITMRKFSLERFLAMKLFLMKLKHRFKILDTMINIKETFIDRIIEYFFGYYRKPLRQLLSFSNWKKFKYSIRDYKERLH